MTNYMGSQISPFLFFIMDKQQVNEIIKKVVHCTINKKIAEQKINNQINKLMITETQSFSTDVYAISEILYQCVAKSIENREGHYYNSTMISYADEQNQVQTVQVSYINYYVDVEEEMKDLCPLIHDVLATAVQFPSYEAYLANAGEFIFKGSSDPYAMGLSIMFPMFEGKLNKHNIIPLIAHEAEHLYQYQMYVNHKNPIKPQDLYNRANYLMQSEDKLMQQIAYIVYFFSDTEIDARAQEFYRELERNKQYGNLDGYNNTLVWEIFQQTKEMYSNILHMNHQEVGEKTMALGLHRYEFVKLIRIQINKFLWKIERIWQQFNINQVNENKMHFPHFFVP